MWDNVTEVQAKLPHVFQDIVSAMNHAKNEWKRWYEMDNPENTNLPGEWDAKCDTF